MADVLVLADAVVNVAASGTVLSGQLLAAAVVSDVDAAGEIVEDAGGDAVQTATVDPVEESFEESSDEQPTATNVGHAHINKISLRIAELYNDLNSASTTCATRWFAGRICDVFRLPRRQRATERA